ncbi:MAG: hypothetical protein J6V36_05040 [Clostridia bacterium]|nr:hypothetical protein [Clostridia bacterium]
MKLNAKHRALALVLATLMLLSVAVVIWDITANALTTNYAKGCSYTVNSSGYSSGKEDSGSLLTDGVVASEETNGVTVAYVGTNKTQTIVFNLGSVKYDIKAVKFMNVFVSGNRDFAADAVTISVAKTMSELGSDSNTFTYESIVQSGTNYFNYTYTLSTEAVGQYVRITMSSPQYVLSLSEIEIWGSGNPVVEDEAETVVTNYVSGKTYTVADASYSSGFEDNGKLLTDGNIALEETKGVTVNYVGTNKTYTLVFDLGGTRDDIKTVKFRNVRVSGNRDFNPTAVVIAATETTSSAEPTPSAYTYVKETQSGSEYFDFIYTLNNVATGRYIYVTMNTPQYVLSLSEIEILSAPQSNSSIVVPDPIDTTPKFDVVLSAASSFKGNDTFELLCEIKNIKATYGIVAVDFVVSYNKSAFTPLYPSGNDLSSSYIKTAPKSGSTLLWEDIGTYCDTANGKVYMRFAHKTAENGDGTKKDGELVFKILFTAKVSTGSYDFVASGCRGTDPGSSNYKKLTEVYANGSSCTATAASFSSNLVPSVSGVEVVNGYVYGLPHKKTAAEVKAMFEGNVNLVLNENGKYVSTGSVVISEDGNEAAVIIVLGDVDGTGVVDATDYLLVKNDFTQVINLEGHYAIAADTNKSGSIDSTDYLKIKSHFLGTNLLF